MEQKEFDSRIELVNTLLNQVAPLKEEALKIGNSIGTDISNYLNLSTNRDSKFKEYLNYLKDFNYSDALTTPSDLFPGIRTVSDTVNPEELNKKTEAMKELATDIEEKHKQVESLSPHILVSMKKLFGLLSEIAIEENQIYDASLDILQDLDSIYDIGQIARATK